MATRLVDSTLTFADLYGGRVPGRAQGDLMEKDVSEASGGDFLTNLDLSRPAIFWMVLVGLLVAIRILWEYG